MLVVVEYGLIVCIDSTTKNKIKKIEMALKEKNANEEPTTDTAIVAIQILLAMGPCLLTLACRLSVKPLIKQPPKPPTP